MRPKIKARILFLVVLLVSARPENSHSQDKGKEKPFRDATMSRLKELDKARLSASALKDVNERLIRLHWEGLSRVQEGLDEQTLEKLRSSLVQACRQDITWRKEFESLEEGVRKRYSGELPLWFTQDRSWRRIDEHLTRCGPNYNVKLDECGRISAETVSGLRDGATTIKKFGERGGAGESSVRGMEFITYYNLVRNRITKRWTWAGRRSDVEVTVRFGIQPNGEIVGLKVIRGSGDPSYDDSVFEAISKATPLPPPPENYRRDFMDVELTFRPKDLHGW